jgi:uncharacterized protein
MNQLINEKPSLIKAILNILAILCTIQVIRLVLYRITALAGSTSGWYQPYGEITNGMSMLFTAFSVWMIYRPPFKISGFTGFDDHSRIKTVEIAGGIALLALAAINLVINPDQIISTLVSCLVFPLFEEPLFRGWIWNKLSPALPFKGNGILTIFLVSVLFAICHLGYWDVVSLHLKAGTTMEVKLHIMQMKMMVASIIGIITGILRWKTGNIYASVLFHAAWNLFGR